MSDILSKKAADDVIISNLLKEIRRLKRKGNMGEPQEPKVLFDANGDTFVAHSYVQVSEAELKEKISAAQNDVAEIQGVIDFSNKLQSKEPAPTEPATEAPVAPVEPEQPPVAPEQPIEAPQAPVEPETPAEPVAPLPAQEEQPAIDPAVAPAPVAPIVIS